jgi:hypothetical protein
MHCFGYSLVTSTVCAELDPGAHMGCIRLPFLNRVWQPPPNLAEVMARQIELLNQLVHAQMGYFHQQSWGRDEPPSASYQDFLSTQPPLFHKADEPLDADAWLCTIESKFALLSAPCSDENKALFAAQQLRGIARLPIMSSPKTNSGPPFVRPGATGLGTLRSLRD